MFTVLSQAPSDNLDVRFPPFTCFLARARRYPIFPLTGSGVSLQHEKEFPEPPSLETLCDSILCCMRPSGVDNRIIVRGFFGVDFMSQLRRI
jgi:hypothetical protein